MPKLTPATISGTPRPARSLRLRGRAALLALLIAAAGLSGVPAGAAEVAIAVLVNANNPVDSLSSEEVGKLFLKKTVKWGNGERVLPVDLHEQSAVRESFSKQFHGKGTAAIKAFWQKMIFSGRDVPPPEKTSVADVAAFVRSNAGGVGYVPASYDAGAGVKVLQVTP
jgi:ABC-type phosphate transport system substrate-binding protein